VVECKPVFYPSSILLIAYRKAGTKGVVQVPSRKTAGSYRPFIPC